MPYILKIVALMFSLNCGNTAPLVTCQCWRSPLVITCFIDNFIFENGCRYEFTLNEMMGALECCKLELYERPLRG